MKVVTKERNRLVFEHIYSQKGAAAFTFIFTVLVLLLNNTVREAEPFFSIENFLFLLLSCLFSAWFALDRLVVCEFDIKGQEVRFLRTCWLRRRECVYNLSEFTHAELTKLKSSIGTIYGLSFFFSDGSKVDLIEENFLVSVSRSECVYLIEEISDILRLF